MKLKLAPKCAFFLLASVPFAYFQFWAPSWSAGTLALSYDDWDSFFPGVLYPAIDQSNAKYGYIDVAGKYVIQPRFDLAGPFGENLLP